LAAAGRSGEDHDVRHEKQHQARTLHKMRLPRDARR
jgi:hypothetical protein